MFSSQVTLDSYHSTLSLCDNLTVCFHLGQHNSSAYTVSLLHSHRNFGYLHGSLTPTQKFRISPRVSYTHTEIWDLSPGLLHPHRNFRYLPGSLTPTQDLSDTTAGLLHPHRTFRILPRVSFTHTGLFGYYRGSPSPTQDLSPKGIYGPLLALPNTH